ncbi:MAG TPA: 50S ribosomal protein L33 [bacterium]|nr:50S ribosomal protein L33 [bacterium]HPN41897.1 50S ribosomal protein L33 [bacterium]
MRDLVILECTECKQRNYNTDKNKRLHSGRIEHKKFCPWCNKRTVHKETR